MDSENVSVVDHVSIDEVKRGMIETTVKKNLELKISRYLSLTREVERVKSEIRDLVLDAEKFSIDITTLSVKSS